MKNEQRNSYKISDGEQKLSPVPSGFVRVGTPQGEIASDYWNSFVMCA